MSGTIRGIGGLVMVAVLVAAGGCGGGEDGGGAQADGLPRFVSGFEAMCKEATAFDGAAEYEDGSDPYPIALLRHLEEVDTYFLETGLPEGRVAPEIANPDDPDPAERERMAEISVVGCIDVGESEPSGSTCDYEDDDGGDVTTLEVLDATYVVTLHEAKTATVIDTVEIEVAGADHTCPIVASIDEGETTMLPSVDPDVLDEAIAGVLG
ncbi:MAG: hypothetical protein H0W25_03475 [Acidimicrobiia bacterium]|nr:hypothetical protein [Acidimicrobiia bacterium]